MLAALAPRAKTSQTPGSAGYPDRMWRACILVVLAVLIGWPLACSTGERPRHSVLLVTLDTTRADALTGAGAPAGLTPHLDALAAEGVLYERAYTVAPLTLPSHASMLTGLYPPRHGVRTNGTQALPASAKTLAEWASDSGAETAAFVGALVLSPSFGLDQGFETYDSPKPSIRQRTTSYGERPASEVVAQGLANLGLEFDLARVVRVVDAEACTDCSVRESSDVVSAEREAQVVDGGDAVLFHLAGVEPGGNDTFAVALSQNEVDVFVDSDQAVQLGADLGGLGNLDEERRR